MKNEVNINKPFSMVYEEFKIGLANLINNSGLPMFMIESILENFLSEAKSLARQQYQSDKVGYEKVMFEQGDKSSEVKE